MTKFNWYKGIGYGALIWAIMFAVSSIIVAFGAVIDVTWGIALAVLSGVVAYLLAINARAPDMGQALGYGVLWVAIGIALDLVITQQYVTGLFSMWAYYLAYGLVLFAPTVQFGLSSSSTSPHAV